MVFVVDDDASVRRGLERLLRSAGYAVVTFASAREFLERADCERPGCLVLDVRMPGPSGLDLYEALINGGHRIPAVFITGHADGPMAQRAMSMGAVDFLAKVFDDEIFLGVIAAVFATPPPPSAS